MMEVIVSFLPAPMTEILVPSVAHDDSKIGYV
jgi:hypothetical protein